MKDANNVRAAVNLMNFLAQKERMQQRPVLRYKTYESSGSVISLQDYEDHEGINIMFDGEDSCLLRVKKILPPEMPVAPKNVDLHVEGDITDMESPLTLLEISEAGIEGSEKEQEWIDEHQYVERWLAERNEWIEQIRRVKPAVDLYRELFRVQNDVKRQGETFELVLGCCLLSWHPEGDKEIQRHILTQSVEITMNPVSGEINVMIKDDGAGLRFESDMIGLQFVPSGFMEEAAALFADSEDLSITPNLIKNQGEKFINLMHADGRTVDSDERNIHSYPTLSFSPMLILRKRKPLDLTKFFADVSKEIEENGEVPAGLLPLVNMDNEPQVSPSTDPGALIFDEEDFFTLLPLNDQQKKILRRVDLHAQTVVQGPPGTGKTHVAAALISHLLAQGKRILITAETDRALIEIRNKIPEVIRDLTVSVIGDEASDRQQLAASVEKIVAESNGFDEDDNAEKLECQLRRAEKLKEERQRIYAKLADAYEAASSPQSVLGFEGTLGELAEKREILRSKYEWVTQFPELSDPYKLSFDFADISQIMTSLDSCASGFTSTDSEWDLIDPDSIPSVEIVRECLSKQRRAEERIQDLAARRIPDESAVLRTLDMQHIQWARNHLKNMGNVAREVASLVTKTGKEWDIGVFQEFLFSSLWRQRYECVGELIATAEKKAAQLPVSTQIYIDGNSAFMAQQARGLLKYLKNGGKPIPLHFDGSVKIGLFTPRKVKKFLLLLTSVRINGEAAVTEESLEQLLAAIDLDNAVRSISKLFPDFPLSESAVQPREKFLEYKGGYERLGKINQLAEDIAKLNSERSDAGLSDVDWKNPADIDRACDAVELYLEQSARTDQELKLSKISETLRGYIKPGQLSAGPLGEMADAIQCSDVEKYQDAYARFVKIQVDIKNRNKGLFLYRKIYKSSPSLAGFMVDRKMRDISSAERTEFLARFQTLKEAVRWQGLCRWISDISTYDVNLAQRRIAGIEDELQDCAKEIASLRSWKYAVSRLSNSNRGQLRSYVQQVQKLGKGTGKLAGVRRRDIRKSLRRCAKAVPVWIMPLYRVVEQFELKQNMFDIVIVDEASQASLSAVFLQYLAPKIVVIGDDKQVSPSGIGIDQMELRELANEYFSDDYSYKALWEEPTRSLFDHAVVYYGGQIVLVEHRRCVPEIVNFCNSVVYEPSKIHLEPVREVGVKRLAPFRVVYTPEGRMEGKSSQKKNETEARSLVEKLVECLSDPQYEGKTFGVISLSGEMQAKRIQEMLLAKVDAKTWEKRELQVGIAPAFQGAERDVIFLSMVDSVIPGQRSGSRTKLQDVQRYNVAVSRAKDQIWLFHSISLNQLGNREDLRYRLIEYAQRISNNFEEEPSGLVPVSESVRVKPFDSLFEQRVYNRIIERGYRVTPQYPVMGYRIDLVVEGEHGKLAVECDGDVWHGADAQKNDMRRQRDLERCGWEFYRIWESDFYANPQKALEGLWSLLDEKNIFPLTDIFTEECVSLGDDISGGKNKSSVPAPAQVPQQSR